MKKVLSFLLAVFLILGLSTTAFAEEITENQGTAQSPVKGTYVAETEGGTVFSVEIEWSGLEFTYIGESAQKWDPEKLEYTSVTASGCWHDPNGTITVKNSSNTSIVATPSYEAATGYDQHNMIFGREKLYLNSAEPIGDATTGTVQTGTISVKPSGKIPADTNGTIGTITVTITEFDDIDANDASDYMNYWGNKYVSFEDMNDPMMENLIVVCRTQDHVAAVEVGRKYVVIFDDDYTLFMGFELHDAANGRSGEITQAELNKIYIDTITFEQTAPIQIKYN